jgi:hypothetical protein
VALAAELPEPLGHAGQHAIALARGHGLGQVLEPPLNDLRELARGRLPAHHALERPRPDVRIGHPSVGELPDVGRNPMNLLERAPPRNGPGAACGHERAVNVEQQDAGPVAHGRRIGP